MDEPNQHEREIILQKLVATKTYASKTPPQSRLNDHFDGYEMRTQPKTNITTSSSSTNLHEIRKEKNHRAFEQKKSAFPLFASLSCDALR